MKLKKIIGLPAIVSAKHRIVIDITLRRICGIQENDTVRMRRERNLLFICPSANSQTGEIKDLSIGRFNLPMEWAVENHIQIGDCVYLFPTKSGIIVCPKSTDFMCIGETVSSCPLKISRHRGIYFPKLYLEYYGIDTRDATVIRENHDDYFIYRPYSSRPLASNEEYVHFRVCSTRIPSSFLYRNHLKPWDDELYLIGLEDGLLVSV